MTGVAVEDLLGLWSSELRGAKARLRPLFLHAGTAASAGAFLDGVLGPERRRRWCATRPMPSLRPQKQ